MDSVPHVDPRGDRCRDCNVLPGNFHHHFCTVEVCPRCQGRLASCGCMDED
jgi:hypothetical protein